MFAECRATGETLADHAKRVMAMGHTCRFLRQVLGSLGHKKILSLRGIFGLADHMPGCDVCQRDAGNDEIIRVLQTMLCQCEAINSGFASMQSPQIPTEATQSGEGILHRAWQILYKLFHFT